MQWISRKGVLKVGEKKYLSYGDEIPAGFDKRRLKQLQTDGKVGDIPQQINMEALQTDAVKDLESENSDLTKEIHRLNVLLANFKRSHEEVSEEFSNDMEKLEHQLQDSEKLIKDLGKKGVGKKLVKAEEKIQELEAENTELKELLEKATDSEEKEVTDNA